MAMKIKCPRCGKETEYSTDNPYRPFCSERCQLIDLGDWASEKYGIPSEESPEEVPNQDEQSGDSESGKV